MKKEETLRVQRLLEEIHNELLILRADFESNRKLVSVLDHLLKKVDSQLQELNSDSRKFTLSAVRDILEIVSYFADLIDKWSRTFFYNLFAACEL